jgi:hypothetical protein
VQHRAKSDGIVKSAVVSPHARSAGSSPRPPLGSFPRLAPDLVELHDPFAGAVQVIPVQDGHSLFPRQHPLIAFEQQLLGLSVFLLPSQTGAQQAFVEEAPPIIRLLPAMKL